jgi:predicted esterase
MPTDLHATPESHAYPQFELLEQELDKLAEHERWTEAFELFESALPTLSAAEKERNDFKIRFYRLILEVHCGRDASALRSIEALLDCGYPLPDFFLRRIELEDGARLEELRRRNSRILEEAAEKATARTKVLLPEGLREDSGGKAPLFVALHGDGVCQNIAEFSSVWDSRAFLERGCIVLFPQSSQLICHDGYGWLPDPERSREELIEAIEATAAAYPVDTERIYIGGFSGGAIAGLDLLLSERTPLQGFLAVSLELEPAALTEEAVHAAAERGVRGVLMEGELVLPVPMQDRLTALFDRAGLPYRYLINRDTGHAVPDDFREKSGAALDFLLGG